MSLLNIDDCFIKIYKDGSKIIGRITKYYEPENHLPYTGDIYYSNSEYLSKGKNWHFGDKYECKLFKRIKEDEMWLWMI